MSRTQNCPVNFTGWMFYDEDPETGDTEDELSVVHGRNAIDSSYYDYISSDGSCPAISDEKLREMFHEGKLMPPTGL